MSRLCGIDLNRAYQYLRRVQPDLPLDATIVVRRRLTTTLCASNWCAACDVPSHRIEFCSDGYFDHPGLVLATLTHEAAHLLSPRDSSDHGCVWRRMFRSLARDVWNVKLSGRTTARLDRSLEAALALRLVPRGVACRRPHSGTSRRRRCGSATD
jgi:hypothetical protein